MKSFILQLIRNRRRLAGIFLSIVAVYLVADFLKKDDNADQMLAWVKKNGDAELQKYCEDASVPQLMILVLNQMMTFPS